MHPECVQERNGQLASLEPACSMHGASIYYELTMYRVYADLPADSKKAANVGFLIKNKSHKLCAWSVYGACML